MGGAAEKLVYWHLMPSRYKYNIQTIKNAIR